MNIGIDLDDVLVNTVRGAVNFHNKNYGTKFFTEDVKEYGLWKLFGYTKEDFVKELNQFFNHPDSEQLVPVDSSRQCVNKLCKKNNLFVITSRLNLHKEKTMSWLEKNFENKFKGVYFANFWLQSKGKNKSEICKELGVNLIIDDSLEFANECAEKGIKVLLFNTNWNKSDNLHKNITRVYDWNEIVEEIESME